MLRKTGMAFALSAAILAASGTSAYALDCANVSRSAPAEPSAPLLQLPGGPTVWVVQGDWWYVSFGDAGFAGGVWDKVPPGTAPFVLTPDQMALLGFPAGTVNGNYQAGQGFGLLDIAQAPCNASRQTQHGIQAESTRC